jgi:MFS family permease
LSRTPQLIGYLPLLRQYRSFRYLYAAHTLSLLGDWFNTIAILALMSRMTGSSARSIGLVLILKLLPNFLMGPVAGVVADRLSRKHILIVTDLLRFAVVLSILLVSIYPQVWILYVATAVQIALSAFFEPARSASIPNLVPREALPTANALGAVTWSAMFTLGAALGGVVTEFLGWQTAIIFDSLTYLVSALLIRRVELPRRPRRTEPMSVARMTGLPDFLEGLSYLVRQPAVTWMVLVKAAWGIAGSITLLLTLFGERLYAPAGRAALGMSVLYTARAVGTGLGPILSRRITRGNPEAMGRIIGWAFLWGGACYLVFASVTHVALAAACVVLAHLGGSTTWVFSTVLLQRTVPDRYRGRVFAAELGLMTLTTSASTYLYSWLVDVAGWNLRPLAVLLGLTLLMPGLVWLTGRRIWAAATGPARLGD